MPTKKSPAKKSAPKKRSLKAQSTPQGYFDAVWEHFVVKKKPLAPYGLYHGPQGTRSPAGLFIPASVYSKTYDPITVAGVVERMLKSHKPEVRAVGKKLRPVMDLLDDLDMTQQMVLNTHKLTTVDPVEVLMAERLAWAAKRHGLKHPKVLEREAPVKVKPNSNSRNATAARKKLLREKSPHAKAF